MPGMRPYTFFKHNNLDTVPAFELQEFADDHEAKIHACHLLNEGPRHLLVVIWDGEKAVSVTRDEARLLHCDYEEVDA